MYCVRDVKERLTKIENDLNDVNVNTRRPYKHIQKTKLPTISVVLSSTMQSNTIQNKFKNLFQLTSFAPFQRRCTQIAFYQVEFFY